MKIIYKYNIHIYIDLNPFKSYFAIAEMVLSCHTQLCAKQCISNFSTKYSFVHISDLKKK